MIVFSRADDAGTTNDPGSTKKAAAAKKLAQHWAENFTMKKIR